MAREVRKTHPGFQVAQDVYWGDLGVRFLWRLRSIPEMREKYAQGPAEDGIGNPDLLAAMAAPPVSGKREHLGAKAPLVEAARRDPQRLGLDQAIAAMKAMRLDFAQQIPRGSSFQSADSSQSNGRDNSSAAVGAARGNRPLP